VKITAIVLAAFLLVANIRCLLACETAPRQSRGASSCHHGQKPDPGPTTQSCVALAVLKADLVGTGIIAHAATRSVALKAPEFTSGTLCPERFPRHSIDRGLFTVLKI